MTDADLGSDYDIYAPPNEEVWKSATYVPSPVERPLAFVDTETTGLSWQYNQIWELAIILRHHDDAGGHIERVGVWQLPVDLRLADTEALEIGGFGDRYVPSFGTFETIDGETEAVDSPLSYLWALSGHLRQILSGASLVGLNPAFDARFLEVLLKDTNDLEDPPWHYQPVDVKAMIAGRLGLAAPWGRSSELAEKLGVSVLEYATHTALGDAMLARDLYDILIQTSAP